MSIALSTSFSILTIRCRENESGDAVYQGHFKAKFLGFHESGYISTHRPGRPAKSGDGRSLRRMLLTHPPVRRIDAENVTDGWKDSCGNWKAIVANDKGIIMDDLLGELFSCQQGFRANFDFEGGQRWCALSGTVDGIKGWEMLDVLSIPAERREM